MKFSNAEKFYPSSGSLVNFLYKNITIRFSFTFIIPILELTSIGNKSIKVTNNLKEIASPDVQEHHHIDGELWRKYQRREGRKITDNTDILCFLSADTNHW